MRNKKRIAELEQEILALRQSNMEKDKLFSIIAHDLRSPFNSILGFTEEMAKGQIEMEDIPKVSLAINNSARNLFNLLENLLEWSRMKRGMIPFEPELLPFKALIIKSIESMAEATFKKEIEVSYKIPSDIQVTGDIHMIETVMRNLISNAIKFTPKKGKIEILAQNTNHHVEIKVKDSGIGMNHEMVDNLFQSGAFNRKGTEGESSSGLGLIICKDFVEKHGGRIWVESEEGKGSTFHFILPK